MKDKKAYQNLYDAFEQYLNCCAQIAKAAWDSIAMGDFIDSSNARWKFFTGKFESSEEFKELCEILENYDPSRPDPNDISLYYTDYHQYSLSIKSCVTSFLNNTGAYTAIIAERKIETEKLFSHFIEAWEKKNIEVIQYCEIFPLIIETNESQDIEVEGFNFSKKASAYGKDFETIYTFACRSDSFQQSLGDISCLPEETFKALLLILNLYFERPVCISHYYRHTSCLLSDDHGWKRKYYMRDNVSSSFWDALRNKYEMDAYDYSTVEGRDCGFIDWDKYDEFIFGKEQDFIRSGDAPVCIVSSREIEKIKKFITKTKTFLSSAFYKENKYLQIALNHYAKAHDDSESGAVEGVIALEALFFNKEQSELKDKLANRIANLLGKQPAEKTLINELMKRLYSNRCNYVHGGNMSKGTFDLELRNLLRLSLLTFFGLVPEYNSNKKRGDLLDRLNYVPDSEDAEFIRIQAVDFLSLARPFNFSHSA